MTDEVVQKLIEFLQQSSPALWQALITQVYIEGFTKFVWGALFLFFCYLSFKKAQKKKAQYESEYDDGKWMENSVAGILYFAAFVLGLVGFGFVLSSLKWIANPDYYAIRLIIISLRGGI